jgi:predicted tellurium resistance membrane protein TerC
MNTAGLAGVVLYLGSYALLQSGILRGSSYTYAILNLCAASLVLLSLTVAFNLSSAIIQASWVVISVLGIARLIWINRRMRVTDGLRGNAFWVHEPDPVTGKIVRHATPLFLALMVIEFVDLVFAVDSVPAIFAITTDPFIVYTSNIFAILGLRALYFALAAMIHRFRYLKYALALVLVFIGSKIFLVGIIGKIPAVISLSVTLSLIAGGVLFSLWKTRTEAAATN